MILTLSSIAAAQAPLWPDLSGSPSIGGGVADAAVIVAIEDYAFVSDIPGARDNGLDWYSYLTEGRKIPVNRVKLLVDQEATREQIEQTVAEAAGAVGAGGTLWFVFIGHGAPSKDGTDGLLLGMDTVQNAESVYARGLSQSSVLSMLQSSAQTVAVLDTCFSGQSAGGEALVAGLQPLIPDYSTAPGDAVVLSAGRSDEFAGPLPGADRPAFSYLVLGALQGWGDADGDGQVTPREATDYATMALEATLVGRSQSPQLGGGGSWSVASGGAVGPSLSQLRRAMVGPGAAPAAVLPEASTDVGAGATLCIWRDRQIAGSVLKMQVLSGEVEIGRLGPGRHFCTPVSPGAQHLQLRYPGMMQTAELTVNISAGETAYGLARFVPGTGMGSLGPMKLELTAEPESVFQGRTK